MNTDFSKQRRLAKNWLKITALTGLALSVCPAAMAAGTAAETIVPNSFILDYTAGGAVQETVTNVDDPIEFRVDRMIDLTVTSQGNQVVVADAKDQDLIFSVTNTGNALQAYKLRVVNDSGDDFDVLNSRIFICPDDGDGIFEPGGDDGEFIAHDETGQTMDFQADQLFWVAVRSDIPSGRGVEGGTGSEITLIAETMEPSTSENFGAPVGEETNDHARSQNVFADESGTAHEMANQGDHSASASYTVEGVHLMAERAFSIHSQSGTNCSNLSTPATDGFAIPGACVEYKFMIKNMGTTITAEDITFQNTLDTTLKFALADMSGFTGGELAQPGFDADCATTACNIVLSEASLPPSATGIVTIRALLK